MTVEQPGTNICASRSARCSGQITTRSKPLQILRHTLWEIQKAFGPGWLAADRETIGFHIDANIWVDVHRFESLLSESRAQNDVSLRIPLLPKLSNFTVIIFWQVSA